MEITLQDVSKADAPAEMISTQTIETEGAQVPIAYALKYDPARIDAKNTYAVRATITEGGQAHLDEHETIPGAHTRCADR